MVQYAVKIGQTIFTELTDVQASTTINPFGDRYICEFRDNEGNQFDQVSYTDPVEIFARDPTAGGGSIFTNLNKTRSYNNISYNQTTLSNDFNPIFEGYVVESDGGEEGSRDVLTVTVYSFDQIIRNERVSNDQSGNAIATALEDIIKTDTPVEYVSGNVSVGDNRTLNRPLQGLTVEEALRVLSLRSENENYGVNDSREFFFRQRVESSGQKDISDSDVTNYSVPERGKESKNEVTVNYDQDNDRVTVSNGSNQLNVQDSLGTQDPVGFPDEISRPSITDRQEALAEGREFLRQRENTLAGRVTVVGDTDFLSNGVGDTVNVTITPRGIDDEFVLVGKEVDYIRNEISFDIIQKRGDQDSLLKAIGQQLKREELSGTDQGTPSDKVTQTSVRVDIEQSYSGVTTQSKKVTTICRNQLREAWRDDESVEIATAVLGDVETVTRATTEITNNTTQSSSYNQLAYNSKGYNVSQGVTLTPVDNNQLEIGFDLGGSGNVIGFKDIDGDLLFAALLDSTVTDPSGTLTITINDGETDKSVLTNTGQEAVRDLFRGNTSLLVDEVEYGDSGTDPQESDTTITAQVSQTYDNSNILSVDTTTEWQNNTSITNTDRVIIDNDTLTLAQSAFVKDASGSKTSGDYSGGDARALDAGGDKESFNFTLEYETTVDVAIRSEVTAQKDYQITEVYIDNNFIDNINSTTTLEWTSAGSKTLSAGSHTVTIEVDRLSGNVPDNISLDVIAVYDNSLSYNFDNNNGGSGGYLDGPGLYPSVKSVDLDTIALQQQVSAAELQTTFVNGNTQNGQFVEIGNGKTNTANNSETVSVDFDTPASTINATLGLDGFGSRTTATPQQRFNGQEVDLAEIFADLAVLNKSDVGRADYEVIFSGSEVNGLTLNEAGQVNSNGDALTRSIFPEIQPSGEAVIFSEDLGFFIS